ncbi:MAG: hypothetical protein DCC67_20305, partial [Planctomycetota bacterium]
PYAYRIGKYEVSERMIDVANALGGLGVTQDARGPDYPATSVTWFEAARFVNWLNASTGHAPAYKFDAGGAFQLWQPSDAGYDPSNLYRNRRAKYFLPSLNEWHKAAYYDPAAGVYYDYPTGSDAVPDGIDFPGDPAFDAVFYDGGLNPGPNTVADVGVLSPYGTAGQGGNVREWEETAFDRINDAAMEDRLAAGGSVNDHPNLLASWNAGGGTMPQLVNPILGFRIAGIVPEPRIAAFLGMIAFTLLRYRRPTFFSISQ